MYRQRGEEDENHNRFYNIMKDIKSNEEDVKLNHEYANNPNVFIGSGLGYLTLDKWKAFNKQKLWILECNNKTIDDINRNIPNSFP